MKNLKIALFVSVVFLAAGCESHSTADPIVPQEIVLARIDPDAALAQKVERALGGDASAAYGVEVTAREGKVELWGTVDSTVERKRLELRAAGVVGVKSIVNHLNVDPGA